MDVDDIVDELLKGMRENGCTLTKMQYEMCKLTGACKEKREHEGTNIELTFALTATWQDLGDAIELELLVEEALHDWSEKDCIAKCSAVLASIKQEKTYQSLYAAQHGMDFDDFESNN
jgi:hypothetical protein